MFLASAPIMGANVGIQTLFQQAATDTYRGSLFGTVNTTMALASLVGMGVGTSMAVLLGPAPILAAASLFYIASGTLARYSLASRESNANETRAAAREPVASVLTVEVAA